MDINPSDTLQKNSARDEKDEKHICPLQLTVIQRALELWTNPNDIVLDPFNGIGSTVYQSLKMGRRGIGIELKDSYYKQSVLNCENILKEITPLDCESELKEMKTKSRQIKKNNKKIELEEIRIGDYLKSIANK